MFGVFNFCRNLWVGYANFSVEIFYPSGLNLLLGIFRGCFHREVFPSEFFLACLLFIYGTRGQIVRLSVYRMELYSLDLKLGYII